MVYLTADFRAVFWAEKNVHCAQQGNAHGERACIRNSHASSIMSKMQRFQRGSVLINVKKIGAKRSVLKCQCIF